ncbi:ATP-binding cassette domain-containing protein [Enterococcus termitis]
MSIAALLDMTDKLKQHPFDLSGGECQRAALGKVLLADPSVLLLDEPTKGIDNYAKKQLIQLLKELAGKGKTILVVTHDLDFAAELSDRCGLFFQHNLLTTANPKEFLVSMLSIRRQPAEYQEMSLQKRSQRNRS